MLKAKIVPNCSAAGKSAFANWQATGEPVLGFIHDDESEELHDGGHANWHVREDGSTIVELQDSDRQRLAQWERQLRDADLWKFREMEFKKLHPFNFQQNEGLQMLDFYRIWADQGRNVMFRGAPGTGKTALAVAMGRYAKLRGDRIRLVRWHKFLIKLRNTQRGHDTGGQWDMLQDATKTDLLILDEIGMDRKSKATDFESENLFEIISGRYGNDLPTLCTTNLTQIQIEKLYGRSLTDRLFDTRGMVIDFDTETNYRQAAWK